MFSDCDSTFPRQLHYDEYKPRASSDGGSGAGGGGAAFCLLAAFAFFMIIMIMMLTPSSQKPPRPRHGFGMHGPGMPPQGMYPGMPPQGMPPQGMYPGMQYGLQTSTTTPNPDTAKQNASMCVFSDNIEKARQLMKEKGMHLFIKSKRCGHCTRLLEAIRDGLVKLLKPIVVLDVGDIDENELKKLDLKFVPAIFDNSFQPAPIQDLLAEPDEKPAVVQQNEEAQTSGEQEVMEIS